MEEKVEADVETESDTATEVEDRGSGAEATEAATEKNEARDLERMPTVPTLWVQSVPR